MASPSIFISYAHEDRTCAAWIAGELRAVEVEVFLDVGGLSAGDRLSAALQDAVTGADVFVFVATVDSLVSEWTRREFQWAMDANRRICAIYPTSIDLTAKWPELADLVGVDATKSFCSVIEDVVGALPACGGRVASLDVEVERRDVDLSLCAELLRGVVAAVQRHVATDTWVDDFSLEDCFLWTAHSGAPPLADTHLFVAPRGSAALKAAQHRRARESEIPDSQSRVAALRGSLITIAQRLLQAVAGTMLRSNEAPSEAFARCKDKVATLDHKRLFNYLCLVYDLTRGNVLVTLPTLLDRIQQQCVYAESPHAGHRQDFASIFDAPREELNPSLTVVVITHAENPAILACLESVYVQSQLPTEVILIEDTPRSGSGEPEAHFRVDHHVCLPPSASHAATARRARCRRVGTALASNDVLLYLDGDTILGPRVIEEVINWWRERDRSEGCVSLLIPDVELELPAGGVTYKWVAAQVGSGPPLPRLSSFSGAGILRSWHDSAMLRSSGRTTITDSLSWRNVSSRCWSVVRDDVLSVGNWDDAYEGWGTEETDLAYRLHLECNMRVRLLARSGAYAVHLAHPYDVKVRAEEHARNEARLIHKFPNLAAERMALAHRLGIAEILERELEKTLGPRAPRRER